MESWRKKKTNRNPQLARAFPENPRDLAPPRNLIQYPAIEESDNNHDSRERDAEIPRPVLDAVNMALIFSTNAETLNLQFGLKNRTYMDHYQSQIWMMTWKSMQRPGVTVTKPLEELVL